MELKDATTKTANKLIDYCNGYEDSIFEFWANHCGGNWHYNYHNDKIAMHPEFGKNRNFTDSVNAVKYAISDLLDAGIETVYYSVDDNTLYTVEELKAFCASDPLYQNDFTAWMLDACGKNGSLKA